MKKAIAALLLVALLLPLTGCGKDKHISILSEQNKRAGLFIAENGSDSSVRQAGLDIAANSDEIQNWTGKPSNEHMQPYSPANSATARSNSKVARETPWYIHLFRTLFGELPVEAIFEAVGVFFPQFGWVVGLAAGAWGLFKKWKADQKVLAGYQGANRILQTVRNGDALSVEGVKKILADAQSIYNVGPEVIADLERLWRDRKLSKVEDKEPTVDFSGEKIEDGDTSHLQPGEATG